MVDGRRIRISANTKRREEAQAFLSELTVEIFEGRNLSDKDFNILNIQELGTLWLVTKGREKKIRSDEGQRSKLIFTLLQGLPLLHWSSPLLDPFGA